MEKQAGMEQRGEEKGQGWKMREMGGDTHTHRKEPSASIFNRAGLAFKWSGLRADGLKTHCGSHISKQNMAQRVFSACKHCTVSYEIWVKWIDTAVTINSTGVMAGGWVTCLSRSDDTFNPQLHSPGV